MAAAGHQDERGTQVAQRFSKGVAKVVRLDQSDQAGATIPAYLRHLAKHLLLREAVRELRHRGEPIVAAFHKAKQPQPQSESDQAGADQFFVQAP